MKKYISMLLIAVIILTMSSTSFASDDYDIGKMADDTALYVYETVSEPQFGSIGGEWAILGLARSGVAVPKDYFESYYVRVENLVSSLGGVLHKTKYTEYSRLIIALTAIGKNPENVGGYNLLKPLGDFKKTLRQGINGAIWALIALDCGNYQIPENPDAEVRATREMYVNHILDKQLSDGGWTLSGDVADADVTAMVLQAFSNYQDNTLVKTATSKALECLSKMQNENGGFSSYETENSESSVQVLVALCELGISIYNEAFVKNGNTVLDNLMTFCDGKNGFRHIRNGDTNQMATEQCLYALVALKRALQNNNTLYDMQDAHVSQKAITGKTFADISGHKNQNAIEELASRGIINGKSENCFDPNGTMTRAEFATIIVKGLGLSQKDVAVFDDVTKNDWYYDYVNTAFAHGIIKGISEQRFNPDGTIKREEATVMIARGANLLGIDTDLDTVEIQNILSTFPDHDKAADWSQSSLAFCFREGLLSDELTEINPRENVTRSEIAQVLFSLLSVTNRI